MSDRLRESVSALMDGEADELELRRLLSDSASEEHAAVDKAWSSYHLAREVMRGNDQGISFQHLDISRQVRLAIDDEPQASVTDQSLLRSWLKPVAGFAVAASVAMGVVIGVQGVGPVNPGLNDPATITQPIASRVYPVRGSSLQASGGSAGGGVNYRNPDLPGDIALSRAAADLEAQKRLEKYMLRHTERAALNNGQGMISYARVVNFETE